MNIRAQKIFNEIKELEKNNVQITNTFNITENNLYLLSKDNFHNNILPEYDNSVDLYYSYFYPLPEIKEQYNILINDLKLVLKHNILIKDIEQENEFVIYDKVAKQYTKYTLHENKFNNNNPGRNIKKGQQIAATFTESLPLHYLANKITQYKCEPFGSNTSPDILICYNNDKAILIEMKAVQCTFNNKQKLLCNFNNATNSIPVVQEELNNYLSYNKNINKFINENKTIKRKLLEELTVFVYYYVDSVNNKVYFFDCDIVPMPLALTMKFNKDGTLNKLDNDAFDSKSNGENSKNNNACIGLLLKQGFNNPCNKLIDRLWLWCYSKTFDGNDHLITNDEYKQLMKEKKQKQYLLLFNETFNFLSNNLYNLELIPELIQAYNNIVVLNRKLNKNKNYDKNKYLNNKKLFSKIITKYKKRS